MFFKKTYQTLNLIKINKERLLNNFSFFQSISGSKVCPVLKSNAYGHGLKLVGKFVDQEIKPEFVCVDSLFEAYELKKSGVKTKVLVMGYTFPENFKFRKIDFHLPVYDLQTLGFLNHFQPGVSVHLKIDTGMNRLGIKEDELEFFVKKLKKIKPLRVKIVGIYSHLSSADDPKKDKITLRQIEKFKKVVSFLESEGFEFKYKHIQATAGLTRFPDSYFNLARIGLGFYGISPFSDGSGEDLYLRGNLKPALTFITHLCQIKKVRKGETVGYNQKFRVPREMVIGIMPLGYYDGLNRKLSNKGKVKIKNVFCPIIGNVCMNLSMVDISEVRNPIVGQEVVVFDDCPDSLCFVKKHSLICGTIPYELLVNLAESTRRVLV